MEIDITDFFNGQDPSQFSASRAELGNDAADITWRKAVAFASEPGPMLDTLAKLCAFADHMKGFGAWEPEEIAAWTPEHCNALFIQLISGDMREAGADGHNAETFDWEEFHKDSERGQIAGRFYRGDDGRVYYHLGD